MNTIKKLFGYAFLAIVLTACVEAAPPRKSGGTATATRPAPVTITRNGTGPGTLKLTFSPGRYRAEVRVSNNTKCSFGRCGKPTNAIFAPESMGGLPMVSWMNEIAASYSDFEVFRVSRRDEVWVRIDVAPSATWTIKVTPL